MSKYITLLFSAFFISCGQIIKQNKEYEANLPYRFIMEDIHQESNNDKKFLTEKSWEEYWQKRLLQLKRSGNDDLVPFIIRERRKRGLPDLKGYGR